LCITGPIAPNISGNYSVTPITGATSYTWSVSNNQAVIVSGQGTPNIQLLATPGFTRAKLTVRASNCFGNGSSKTIALRINNGSSSSPRLALLTAGDISVFPNPSNGHFTLTIPSLEADAKVEVYSAEGRLVLKQSIPANTEQTAIDLQRPAAGLYQLLLVGGEEIIRTKVVVQ
jgi:hypothetical protein